MIISQFLRHWSKRLLAPDRVLKDTYRCFRELLAHDRRSLELLSDLEDIHYGGTPVDWARVTRLTGALRWSVENLVRALSSMNYRRHSALEERFRIIAQQLDAISVLPPPVTDPPYTLTVDECASAPHLAGGKAHILGRLLRDTTLPQPRGFIFTTNAANLLIAHNNLRHRLDELLGEVRLTADNDRLTALSREMTTMIEQAEIPDVLAAECRLRLAQLGADGDIDTRWAVRSSAIGEDGSFSFAGQYRSILPVLQADLLPAYKAVIASKYHPGAVLYRIRCGLADEETPMAVLVMELAESQTSGVIYTRNPTSAGRENTLTIYAVEGHGSKLVDGAATPEVHRFIRQLHGNRSASQSPPYQPPVTVGSPLLAPDLAGLLADWGQQLERLLGGPQDIEWCCNRQGDCLLLQCRPLQIETIPEPTTLLSQVHDDLLLIRGTCGAPGIGSGPVHVVHNEAALADAIPNGSVLVLPTLPPLLTPLLSRLRGVIAEAGSRASHFATVAREWGVPVVVGASGATRLLDSGQTVTVDARNGCVYQGRVELPESEYNRDRLIQYTPVAQRLRRLIELVAPLHLTDPAAPDFSPESCTSMHDLIRFVHEKGMIEMFSLVDTSGRALNRAKRLTTPLPLTLSVIDIGGGLVSSAVGNRQLSLDDIASMPFLACWQGLTHPDVTWHDGLAYLDWLEADRVSGGIISLSSARLGSYAVIAADYLHLMMRFGYHFAVLHSLAGPVTDSNYLAFRFKGGGGSYENRLQRVSLIKQVLEWAGFTAHSHGDLLDARFDRRTARQTLNRLTIVGFLQGKSQLLDIALDNSDSFEQLLASCINPLRSIIDEAV